MSSSESEMEVEEELPEILEEEPRPGSAAASIVGLPLSGNSSSRKRLLMKQLSMRETTREAKWEKRRRQILHRRKMMMMEELEADAEVVVDGDGAHAKLRSLTDEDLDELRGSIELGFGFEEENGGHILCDTLPALDLYFAVNRQFSDPKLQSSPSPTATSSSSTLCGTPSPRSPQNRHSTSSDSWTIFNPVLGFGRQSDGYINAHWQHGQQQQQQKRNVGDYYRLDDPGISGGEIIVLVSLFFLTHAQLALGQVFMCVLFNMNMQICSSD
ncbi:hypothetical protein J5N97_002091 [Dioscorea zingiberensis]|uniref:Uncharacterized protein n=1 Tax=Dioscorea zingiberensis TaxID=325984 RepID=A0A9D5D1J4_9LILI|nr:hypothetical protein J5N97_002091 [Dioscorea zingiberensis]